MRDRLQDQLDEKEQTNSNLQRQVSTLQIKVRWWWSLWEVIVVMNIFINIIIIVVIISMMIVIVKKRKWMFPCHFVKMLM